MREGRYLIRFRGALYAQGCGLGDGCAMLSRDEVARILAGQYFNRGRTTVERLKERWVDSPYFTLTEIYPSMLDLGVAPGKTGKTFSTGLPLIVDTDVNSTATTWRDVSPKYLTLDGQNRVVSLRRTFPRQKYPAYVGDNILDQVLAITKSMDVQVDEAEEALHALHDEPTPGTLLRLRYFFDRGLITKDEFPAAAQRATRLLAFNGSLYRCVGVARS